MNPVIVCLSYGSADEPGKGFGNERLWKDKNLKENAVPIFTAQHRGVSFCACTFLKNTRKRSLYGCYHNHFSLERKGTFFLGNQRFETREFALPELGEQDVLIQNKVCGICGIDRAEIKAGMTVCVIGGGPIGLMMVQLARRAVALLNSGKINADALITPPLRPGECGGRHSQTNRQ